MVGASHFTLRCGRRLPGGSYQAPIVALVASFATSASSGLLSPEQAATLFHEFGHALHSLLSRTQFQHHFGAAALRYSSIQRPYSQAPCMQCMPCCSPATPASSELLGRGWDAGAGSAEMNTKCHTADSAQL